jgi:hypothetical protein
VRNPPLNIVHGDNNVKYHSKRPGVSNVTAQYYTELDLLKKKKKDR